MVAVPTISKGRDHSELQDMYRRALAASWAAQPGELSADLCIEDIFSGGDGWKPGHAKAPVARTAHNESEEDLHKHHRADSNASMKSQSTIKGNVRLGHKHSRSRDHTESPAGEKSSSEGSERGRTGFRKAHEVDEFDMRDDLVAWKLPDGVIV